MVDSASDGATIYVPEGLYRENVLINKNLTVLGDGIDRTCVDGNGNGPVFTIVPNRMGNVQIKFRGMTIRNGRASYGAGVNCTSNTSISVYNCKITENNASSRGGAIALDVYTNAVISGGELTNNTAVIGGGINSFSDSLALSDVKIAKNKAKSGGGGIYTYGNCSIIDSKIDGNFADEGGAIVNWGILEIGRSIIVNNYASRDSGGICNDLPTITSRSLSNGQDINAGTLILNPGVSIVNNTAEEFVGGVLNGVNGVLIAYGTVIEDNKADSGAGIAAFGSPKTELNNVKIIGNHADNRGGGLGYLYNCNVTLNGGEIKYNAARFGGGMAGKGNVQVNGTDVSGNTAEVGGAIYNEGTMNLKGGSIAKNIPDDIHCP